MHYTLCDLFADLTQNSVDAAATYITVELLETEKNITVYIRDNGKGMSKQTLKKALDPFYTDGKKHPNRKIGLGIPFLIQTATDTNGQWDITSTENVGTTVFACFDTTNIDTPPIGDVSSFFRQILTFTGNYEMKIIRKKPKGGYEILRSQLIDALGDLESAASLVLLGDFLASQEEDE